VGAGDGSEHTGVGVTVTALGLPRATWGRLDVACGWRQFRHLAGSSPGLTAAVTAFAPHVVLGVDWWAPPR